MEPPEGNPPRTTSARLALALVLCLAATFLVVQPSGAQREASATEPTPTLPDLLGTPNPGPSPSPSPGRTGSDKKKQESDDPPDSGQVKKLDPKQSVEDAKKSIRRRIAKRRVKQQNAILDYVYSGPTYTTDTLSGLTAQLAGLGMPRNKITRRAWAPFIIAGRASWSNTWGAPRFGPGPKQVRRHEGQDVFCHQGDPVLASESGRVEFGGGGLGGRIARLHRGDGSYWYYAHLSSWNRRDFSSGDQVKRGDVIGYCGASGNAVGTSPHVHFGWYAGAAMDPHDKLVSWLRQAERRARRVLNSLQGYRVANIGSYTTRRLFGDAFLPRVVSMPEPKNPLVAMAYGSPTRGFAVAIGIRLPKHKAQATTRFLQLLAAD